ncbi:MAG: hypothetical protein IJB51_04520, partial [Clostridia bacterium]|nr:hypothetical protein [Clostridia bacterium]
AMHNQMHYHLRWILPEGWSASYKKNVSCDYPWSDYVAESVSAFTITAGERVEATNRLVLEVTSVGRPTCVYLPVILLG